MAAADVLIHAKPPRPTFEPLIQREVVTVDIEGSFDPKKHLAFTPPSKVYAMTDIGYPEDTGVSPVAVSEPFPLFTTEAIYRMRAEVLSEAVWDNCQYSSNLAQCQLRGFAAE